MPPPPVISLSLERLKSLRVRDEVWQLGLARMPTWITEDPDAPYRPLLALCRSAAGGPVGNSSPCRPDDSVGPAAIAALTRLAVMANVRHRPRRLEVRSASLADAVRTDLAECGIEVAVVTRLDAIDEVAADMMRRLGGKAASARFFEPGIDVDHLRDFAEAAAEFHRAAPWNHLSDVDLIHVESGAAPNGLGWFNVLGAAGIERGLGFFPSSDAHEQFKDSEPFDPWIAESGLWLMGFDEIVNLPLTASEIWEQHDLPVADDDGYPFLICHLPSASPKPADAERLAFVTALLRVLATTTEDELDSGRWSRTAQTIDGPVTIELSLPGILEPPRAGARPAGEPLDRRVMEQTLRDIHSALASREFATVEDANTFLATQVGKPPKRPPAQTPEGQAQALVHDAFSARGRLRQKLAREALQLWPDCAEAWVLRAEEMPDLERRLDYYRHGYEAAQRVLGPKPFAEDVGHFWGVIETRPYMRARHGLAGALWDTGRRDEAVDHWQDMLRLNPDDNMGVRDTLVPHLLEARRDAEAEAVLLRYEEDSSATLAYARALLEFRRHGAGPEAQARLDAAIRGNSHVPKYLAGRVAIEDPPLDSYRLGSDDEAQVVFAMLFMAWTSTDGAVEWLGRSIRPPRSERRAQRAKRKKRR
jgi:tetratricopeptide (TPR) repeat protein